MSVPEMEALRADQSAGLGHDEEAGVTLHCREEVVVARVVRKIEIGVKIYISGS